MGGFRKILTLLFMLLALMPITTASMQTYTCPELVEIALESTDEACLEMGANKACYGHSVVDAEPHPEIDELTFNQPGDEADLLEIQAMRLSAMDVETGAWGVALMNLLAYVNNSQPEDVTFLLFGNVEVENMVEPTVSLDVTLAESAQLHLAPIEDAEAVAEVNEGAIVRAKQRLADSSWLRVEMPESNIVGWLPADKLTSTDGLEVLKVVDAFEPYYGPMQAFYLQTGEDDAACPEAPESGLLIQTPEGVAEVNLIINEVNIQLSATAFVQAQPNGDMSVEVISGWANVESGGSWQSVAPGMTVNIPMSAEMSPTGSGDLSQSSNDSAIPVITDSGVQKGNNRGGNPNSNAGGNPNNNAGGNPNNNAGGNPNNNAGGNPNNNAGGNPNNNGNNGGGNNNGNSNGNSTGSTGEGGAGTGGDSNGNGNGNSNGQGANTTGGVATTTTTGTTDGTITTGGATTGGNGNQNGNSFENGNNGNANGNGNGNANGNSNG